jgi:NTE family protein
MIGALGVLESSLELKIGEFDYIVGTSAGAVVAALLGAGITPAQLRAHQLGEMSEGPLADVEWDHETSSGGALPPRPKLGVGSPRMVAKNVKRLRRMPPTAVMSAFAPVGRGSLDGVRHLIEAVSPNGGWVSHPGTWIVALDYDDGRRVPFGREGEPKPSLADAVVASCAIPAWFSPVVIDDHRYIDGGAWSATSADMLRGLELDEVYVVAPMVSTSMDRPPSLIGKLERRWRSRTTKRCMHEVAKLRSEGTKVSVLGPSPDDLRAFGTNVMDVSRRLRVLETADWTTERALRRGELADAG